MEGYKLKTGDLVICKPAEEFREPSNVDFEVYARVIWVFREQDRAILRRYLKQGRLFSNEQLLPLSGLEAINAYQPMNVAERETFLANTKDEPAPHVYWSADDFAYSKARPGDYVEAAVVNNAMNIMPPATMRYTCAQVGEPYSHEIDPQTGKLRATYATFAVLEGDFQKGIWQFRGYCFKNETKPCGVKPAYM